jgi:hypothetical protein
MKSLTVIFFAFLAHSSLAQNIGNARLRWSAAGMEDVSTGATVGSYTCTFETHGTRTAYWRQKNGSYATALTVKGMEGTWADVTAEGKATFHIVADGQTGTLVFEKGASGTFATLRLAQPSGSPKVYKFTITQTTPF